MTRKQYKRANSTVYSVLIIIYAYVLVTLVAHIFTAAKELVTWRTYIQIAGVALAIVVSTILYLIRRETKLCAVVMMGVTAFAYFLIRVFGTNEDTYAYAYPILITSMAYMNVRMVVWGNSVILLANILRLVTHLKQFDETGSVMVIAIFMCLLIAFTSIWITNLLKKFNEENTQKITDKAREQEESYTAGLEVAENIAECFEEAMKMMNILENSLSTSHSSMSNIADSTESTAEAIQKQAVVCQRINDQTDKGGEITTEMTNASHRVENVVEDGAELVRELKLQAENVATESKVVDDVINELTEKVREVENFVGTIINISSQTNLLALNASIEAARAGEAGKGFAVVAEEIRKLSEDTQMASNNITNIIKELNADTERANYSIEDAVESVMKQNEVIETTRGKFEEVQTEVSALIDNINIMDTVMKDTVESSVVISDNISQLSAASEEVAASASEGLDNSKVTMQEVEKCKEIFTSIYELAQELQIRLKITDTEE